MENVNMYDLPDHPDIERAQRTGYPDAREDRENVCPICGGGGGYLFYKNQDGEVVGCEVCLTTIEPYEYEESL